MRVLVVERDAHIHAGHFPNRFAALARGFAELGVAVDVLTQRGWLFEREAGAVPFRVARYPSWLKEIDRVVLKARARWHHPIVWGLADTKSTAVGALAVRRHVRQYGRPDLVVVLSYDTVPSLFALVAGHVDLLVYAFSGPMRWNEIAGRWASAASRRARRSLSIVTASEEWRSAWAERLPGATVTVAPISGVASAAEVPRAAARTALGIAEGDRVALLFGSGHPDFDVDTVVRAFELGEGLDGVRLVAGGKVCRHLDGWDRSGWVRVPGFVTPAQRDRLFAAADVVILSFVEGYRRDSGTLMDAVSYGRPVVASRGSAAAEIVERYRLGVTFTPGDERSLVHAIRQAPSVLDPAVLARARAELSDRTVAERLLEIAGKAPASQ